MKRDISISRSGWLVCSPAAATGNSCSLRVGHQCGPSYILTMLVTEITL